MLEKSRKPQGGVLGFGNKVSDEEAAVLEELAAAF